MSYIELGNLINEGKDDEIREALNGLSEQELRMLLAMVTPEQASYINYLNTFDNAPDSFMDEDEMNDWILSNFSGELPDAGDNEAWNEFYAAGSPFNTYETTLVNKLRPRIKPSENEDFPRSKTLGFDSNGTWVDNPQYEETGRFTFNTMQDAIDYYGKEHADVIKQMYAELGIPEDGEPDTKDVNGDGDTDVVTADTNGNGEKDTAVVTADSEPEKREAVKAAKEDLGLDKKDKTSTGKTKGELEDEPKEKDVVSDEKKKDMTCSDATQKNIMAALLDHRF